MAKLHGISVYEALWTCMDSRFIRGQVLTLTKSHDERLGPLTDMAHSMKQFRHPDPPIAFSDDPVKVCLLLQ